MELISDWTRKETNHFLTLFIGKYWHEPDPMQSIHCHIGCSCGDCFSGYDAKEQLGKHCKNNNPKTNFFIIKSFMEKQWPELWEKYLQDVANDLFFHVWDNAPKVGLTLFLTAVLDLSNLVAFLLEPEQIEVWGYITCKKECPGCTDICWEIICGRDGKVKHPAIEYAEGLK